MILQIRGHGFKGCLRIQLGFLAIWSAVKAFLGFWGIHVSLVIDR